MLRNGIHVPDYYRRDRRIEIIDPLKMPPLPDVGRMPPLRCAPAFVDGGVGGAADNAETAAIATAGSANFFFVATAYFGSPSSVTDDTGNGNTYNALSTTASAGGDPVIKGWWSVGTFTNGMKVKANGAGTFAGIVAVGFSGVAATSTIVQEAAGGGGVGISTVQPGALTPTAGNILITAMGINADDGVPTINSSFISLTAGTNYVAFGGSFYGTCVSWHLSPSGSTNPTWTNLTTRKMAAIMAEVAAAAAGATGFGQPLGGRRNNPVAMFG